LDLINLALAVVLTGDLEGSSSASRRSVWRAVSMSRTVMRTRVATPVSLPQALVTEEVRDNRFTIRTDKPNVRVLWQITGIRQDAWADANRIEPEVDKVESERGTFLGPEVHDQLASAGIFHSAKNRLGTDPCTTSRIE
jgi:hypothetical protein